MKPSATLYFIYCLVSTRWGKSVQIKRDPLHRVYSVNQYGVSLSGVPAISIFEHLRDELHKAGYYSERSGEFKRVHKELTTYISLRLTDNSVDVSIHAYKFSKE